MSRVVNVNIGDSMLKPAGKDTQRAIYVPDVSTLPPTYTHACVIRVAPDIVQTHTHARTQICAHSCDPPPSFASSGGKVDAEV